VLIFFQHARLPEVIISVGVVTLQLLVLQCSAVPVFYRAPAILLGFLALWGVNILVFNAFGINYASTMNMTHGVCY
jgi:hypothetical protein